jgi:tight adherence protein C
VSAATLLAALAATFACAAAAQLFGSRPADAGGARARLRPGAGRDLAARFLSTSRRLRRSGLEHRVPFAAVVAAKLVGATLGGLLALAGAPAAPGRLPLLVGAVLPVAGFLAPDALLEREARRRARRLRGALPDALDVLAVTVASGRSASAGFADLARGSAGPLSRELAVTGAELACGASQEDALASLRRRARGPEIAKLCAAVDRSRRLGSPLADQLRDQAQAVRRDQRREVAEQASRAAPKIQLVVALVLVPSVLLMIVAGLVANADRLLVGF